MSAINLNSNFPLLNMLLLLRSLWHTVIPGLDPESRKHLSIKKRGCIHWIPGLSPE